MSDAICIFSLTFYGFIDQKYLRSIFKLLTHRSEIIALLKNNSLSKYFFQKKKYESFKLLTHCSEIIALKNKSIHYYPFSFEIFFLKKKKKKDL